MTDTAPRLLEILQQASHVVALTGAGISTLAGIPDFRGPQGLYQQPGAERIFDIAWFRRDPAIYYEGCREWIYGLDRCAPGPVHTLLARLEQAGRLQAVITQNIDMLHQKAGSRRVIEVHGSPLRHHCSGCGREATFDAICARLRHARVAQCDQCGSAFKPDTTFFGEALPEAALAEAVAQACRADLMLVLGTSLTVYPAAALPEQTLRVGGQLVIVNAQPTPLDYRARLRLSDLAAFAETVGAWLAD
jgi:NAD-dependent deacetylase